MERNLFELAARAKFRFPFRGMVSVEDLWDLHVESLDLIYKTLNAELKQVSEESLLGTENKKDEELEAKIEILKYIVKVKLEEKELQKKAKERRAQKQKIMELIAEKKDEALKGQSLAELEEMLDKLGD
jgi:hypothetical protein